MFIILPLLWQYLFFCSVFPHLSLFHLYIFFSVNHHDIRTLRCINMPPSLNLIARHDLQNGSELTMGICEKMRKCYNRSPKPCPVLPEFYLQLKCLLSGHTERGKYAMQQSVLRERKMGFGENRGQGTEESESRRALRKSINEGLRNLGNLGSQFIIDST